MDKKVHLIGQAGYIYKKELTNAMPNIVGKTFIKVNRLCKEVVENAAFISNTSWPTQMTAF